MGSKTLSEGERRERHGGGGDDRRGSASNLQITREPRHGPEGAASRPDSGRGADPVLREHMKSHVRSDRLRRLLQG